MREQKNSIPEANEEYGNNYFPTDNGWVKAMRSVQLKPLWARSHHASVLLWIVSTRAWRGPGRNGAGCGPGEAFIGDWQSCGFTHAQYRHAMKTLAEIGYCSFRATNKGTIAKLLSPEIFDINLDDGITERTANDKPTTSKQQPNNKPTTTEQQPSDNPATTEQQTNSNPATPNKNLRIEELELKKEKNKEANNTTDGSGGFLAPSGQGEKTAPSEPAPDIPEAEEEEQSPSSKAIELSKELPPYLKVVCGYPQNMPFNREALMEAKEFFTLNPVWEWWDVMGMCAMGIKLARENAPPEKGNDPYFVCRRFAGKVNKIFDRDAQGDLYLARIIKEINYEAKPLTVDEASELFQSEMKRVAKLKAAAKKAEKTTASAAQ